jgi:uncharacterized membrane protein YgcG
MPTLLKAIGVIIALPFVLIFLFVRAAWRLHPTAGVGALVLVIGIGAVSSNGDDSGDRAPVAARAEASPTPDSHALLNVPDFEGTPLRIAVMDAEKLGRKTVTTKDATSADRPAGSGPKTWQVCFQQPSAEVPAIPAYQALTLYAVPEQEECPVYRGGSRWAVMPDLIGERLDDVAPRLTELGLDTARHFHAHTGKELAHALQEHPDWQVCRQTPEPDKTVNVSTMVELWLTAPSKSCTEPSPSPTPKPKPNPKPEPDHGSLSGGSSGGSSISSGGTTGGSSGGSSSGGSGGTSGGGGSSNGGRTGVGFGQFCSPVSAIATSSDGRPAKCYMGKDANARWGGYSG